MSGRPVTSVIEIAVNTANVLVKVNPRISVGKIAATIDISYGSG